MKKIFISLLLNIILVACVPLGKDTKDVSVVAQSNQEVIEKHVVDSKFLAIASAEGFFVNSYSRGVEHWLRSGKGLTRLNHLSSLEPGYILEEFYKIEHSNSWLTFELVDVKREKVGLRMLRNNTKYKFK